MNITWNQNMRADTKARIESYINKHGWLIPGWVQTVHCNLWDGDAEGTRISINVNYAYRNIVLNFYSSWLDESDEEQSKQVLHEMLHIHLALIADFARDSFNLLCPIDEASKFNESLQMELQSRHEAAVCDLTEVIWNKGK